jgi:hypothetical protein
MTKKKNQCSFFFRFLKHAHTRVLFFLYAHIHPMSSDATPPPPSSTTSTTTTPPVQVFHGSVIRGEAQNIYSTSGVAVPNEVDDAKWEPVKDVRIRSDERWIWSTLEPEFCRTCYNHKCGCVRPTMPLYLIHIVAQSDDVLDLWVYRSVEVVSNEPAPMVVREVWNME